MRWLISPSVTLFESGFSVTCNRRLPKRSKHTQAHTHKHHTQRDNLLNVSDILSVVGFCKLAPCLSHPFPDHYFSYYWKVKWYNKKGQGFWLGKIRVGFGAAINYLLWPWKIPLLSLSSFKNFCGTFVDINGIMHVRYLHKVWQRRGVWNELAIINTGEKIISVFSEVSFKKQHIYIVGSICS